MQTSVEWLNMSTNAIEVKNLEKSYGKVRVLQGINFTVRRGSIFALLGPNGAGKTTTIRILSTLLPLDGGTARIAGHDVVKEPGQVRANIGLTGQYAAVDGYLTGEENLLLLGRLYRLSVADSKRRAAELLKLFDLEEAAKRPAKNYSGGMRRKLDLAMSMIASPPIIFLDEPTTGLDPRSRLAMWDTVKKLAKSGVTILLTTQYMDEADNLADDIVVIDGGKVIASGTPDQLKAKIGSDRIELIIGEKSSFEKAKQAVDGDALQSDPERRSLSIASTGGIKTLRDALDRLEKAKVDVESISLHRPTLDDVFLTLTGHATTAEPEAEEKNKKGKK